MPGINETKCYGMSRVVFDRHVVESCGLYESHHMIYPYNISVDSVFNQAVTTFCFNLPNCKIIRRDKRQILSIF